MTTRKTAIWNREKYQNTMGREKAIKQVTQHNMYSCWYMLYVHWSILL